MKISATAVLACGGHSQRMGTNKLLIDLCGKSVIRRSCEALASSEYINSIVVSAPSELHEIYKKELEGIDKPIKFVVSGSTRQESVKNACAFVSDEIICIHDGARPLVSLKEINSCIENAFEFEASIVCTKTKDTVRIKNKNGSFSPNRDSVYIVRTPQCFDAKIYKQAIESATSEFTDDAQLFDSIGKPVHITEGRYENIKLTTKEDVDTAVSILRSKGEDKKMRIGHGYDVHKLVYDRKLILGGVEIDYEKGLLGHSDADVLTHALMDSILGACAMGDIGKLFPDSDMKYKGADSIELLKEVCKRIREKGFEIENADITVIAQSPKLAPFIDKMRENLSKAMSIELDCISVKATTEEGLGFTGSKEGISAHSVCLVR